MMNAAIVEVMQKTGLTLPRRTFLVPRWPLWAEAVSEHTGFENIGVPFCMTVEASYSQPHRSRHAGLRTKNSVRGIHVADQGRNCDWRGSLGTRNGGGRGGRAVEPKASRLSRGGNPDRPRERGGVDRGSGHISQGTTDPAEDAHRVLGQITAVLAEYAGALVAAGATVIAVGDPTATVEILGPQLFQEYAVHYLNDLIGAIHALATPVIVHICGKLGNGTRLLPDWPATPSAWTPWSASRD